MDDTEKTAETPPPADQGAPAPDATSLGERVREVREHLEKASAALAALDQLLPAGTSDQTSAQTSAQTGGRGQP